MKQFTMINEGFTCKHCGRQVEKHPDGSARNHCPFCLYSKHLDKEFPGDRESHCLGLMEPIDIDYKKNKGYMILHRCTVCQKTILNKLAPDDHFLEFIKKRNPYLP